MARECYQVQPRTFIQHVRRVDARIGYQHPGIFTFYDAESDIERWVDIGDNRVAVNAFRVRLSKHLDFSSHDQLARDIWVAWLAEDRINPDPNP